MSSNGPGLENLHVRLRVNTEEQFREQEAMMRDLLKRHGENLTALSHDALNKTEKSINDRILQIEKETHEKADRLQSAMRESLNAPMRMIQRTAIISALIGGLIAMIPWGVMAYLGMSVTGEAGGYFQRLEVVRAEEARINALKAIEIKTMGSEQYLMLPPNITKIYMCGSADGTPCIRLEE